MWRVGYGDGKESDLPKPLMPTSQAFANIGSATDEQQQNKRGSSNNIEEVGMVASSRWNPTPEQLHGLEEMYRSGTRTPSANQIQQIALKLRRFGKIEGKNVFYWFQNHKARERQKRRRQQQLLNSSSLTEQPLRVNIESLQRKLSGLSRTGFEVGQTKNRETPSNCSTISEESVSMPTAVVAKSRTDERIQFEATEFQQKISTGCTTTAQHANRDINAKNPGDEREYQTLELFPLSISDRDHAIPMIELAKNDSGGPIQFFEFLPLKK